MNLTGLERRWARDILDTMFPSGSDPQLRTGIADLDLDGYLVDLARNMPAMAVLGLRVAIVAVALAPVVLLRTLRTFHGLGREERLRVLDRLYSSNLYVLRAFVMLLKATGAVLYAGTAEVRRAITGRLASMPPVPLARLRRGAVTP